MQEALFAQMQQENEDIYIGDEDDHDGGQPAGQGSGGIMNFLGNMLFGGQRREEEKKQE